MTDERAMAKEGKFSSPAKPGKTTYNVIVMTGGKTRTLKADSLADARSKAAEAVDSIYDSGAETESKVIVRAVEWCQDTTFFDCMILSGYRLATSDIPGLKKRRKASSIPDEKMNQWNEACSWAREHGVKIRRGKITRSLAIMRVAEAGLTEEWNAEWPDFAFTPEMLDKAKETVTRRETYYKRMTAGEGGDD